MIFYMEVLYIIKFTSNSRNIHHIRIEIFIYLTLFFIDDIMLIFLMNDHFNNLRMGFFKSFIWFCKTYPSPAKVLFTGTLFSLSDIVTQLLVEQQPFNYKRNFIFFLSGTLYIGPCLEIWYMYVLPKIIFRYFQNCSKLKRVLSSIGFD